MPTTGATRLRALSRALVGRWLLFAALVVGLLGMHVLTGGDAMDHDGGLPRPAASIATGHSDAAPMAMAEDVAARDLTGTAASGVSAAALGPGAGVPMDGHDAMAGCILFLALGSAVALLTLLLLRTATGTSTLTRQPACRCRRRGPLGRPSLRLVVSVSRI
ncbi:MAG: hypothetical protein ABIR83_07285 [Nakamurella sp.]